MKKLLNRRIFLRGLGGAAVAAPFLSSLHERQARAQSVPASGPPKRLILMFTHYGCITTKFFPAKAHGTLTAADLQPTTLAPLADYASKILIPRGIRAMNEWTSSRARGQGNDPHTQVTGSLLSCQPVLPHSSNPFDFDQSKKFDAKPMGRTLDHVIAEQISQTKAPLLLRVGNVPDNNMAAISYTAPKAGSMVGDIFPGVGSPSQVFSNLTGLFKDDEPMSPDTYAAVKGKSVIDLVRDDLETLERFDMSMADREKLAAWKQLLHETGGIIASAECNEGSAAVLNLTSQNIQKVPTGGLNQDVITASITDTLDAADIYASVAVLSAVCDYNRVIILKYPGNYIFRGLDLQSENHGLSHRIGDAGMQGTCQAGVLDALLKIDNYYAEKFAYLVRQLDSIPEGEGSVLDNTATIWLQEMSDGNAHNLNNMPIIQAGSCGGFFKTGQAVNLVDGSPTMSNGRSEALCANGAADKVDGTTQSTGTEPTIANEPINKYYVSLMNALGVKAGPDGYPLAGGTAEVTHFGRYDKTEDFRDGDAAPPKINSPGGFDALKANA
jgi:hypothetical protein